MISDPYGARNSASLLRDPSGSFEVWRADVGRFSWPGSPDTCRREIRFRCKSVDEQQTLSSSASFVSMMQATDLRIRAHLSGRLNCTRDR